MGIFFKMSQAIQAEFNQKLRKTENPDEMLNELIDSLQKQSKELRETCKGLVNDEHKRKLEEELAIIEQKLEGANRRRDFYIARSRRLEMQKSISEAMNSAGDISRYESRK